MMKRYTVLLLGITWFALAGCGTKEPEPTGPPWDQMKAYEKSTNAEAKREAVKTLARMGKSGELGDRQGVPATQVLLDALHQEEDKELRHWAAVALVHLSLGRLPIPLGDITRPALEEAVKEGDPELRAAAEEALEITKPAAGPPGGGPPGPRDTSRGDAQPGDTARVGPPSTSPTTSGATGKKSGSD
jgi:hypothetical protein